MPVPVIVRVWLVAVVSGQVTAPELEIVRLVCVPNVVLIASGLPLWLKNSSIQES